MKKIEFIGNIALKLLKATHSAMTKLISENNICIDEQRKKALEAFLWWDIKNQPNNEIHRTRVPLAGDFHVEEKEK
jgi:hypothetical protein